MHFPWIFAASVAALAIAGQASGQTMFGQSNQGGSAATRVPTGSSTARSSTGTSAGGTSSAGASVNTTNVAQAAQQNMVTAAAQPTQQRGAFVGADSSDIVNVRSMQGLSQGGAAGGGAGGFGATQRGGASGLNQLQNLFSQGMQQLNQQNQRAVRPQIRTPLRLGFQQQPVSLTRVRHLETHLMKLPGIRFVGAPDVVLEGRTAVLRGTVASEDDRQLAERLAKLNPDVLAVRNELKVDAAATTAAEELPATQP